MVASFRKALLGAREDPDRIDAHIADYVQPSSTARGTVVAFPRPPADVIPDALVRAVLRRGDSPHTHAAYRADVCTYATWLEGEGLSWDGVSPDDLDRYRDRLSERYARTTANRHLSTIRSLYREGIRAGLIATDPAADLRSLRGRDQRDGGVLSAEEAGRVLDGIRDDLRRPSRRLLAMRDLALIGLFIRTGIRRSEAEGLRVGDLGRLQGHHVLTVRGKGRVTRTVKLPADLFSDIDAWLGSAARVGYELRPSDALLVGVRKGGRSLERRPLSRRTIGDVVVRRLVSAGCPPLGPHALRATFATLALEGGAPLYRIQRALGHADPRTTEVYLRKADSLDDNAVDYVRLETLDRSSSTTREDQSSR